MGSDPLVVILPGLDGTRFLFEPLLEHLKLEAQVIEYPERTGTGYADLEPYVRAALPRDREFVLMAWSFSGPLALFAAQEAPPGLRGVVLCASFARRPAFYVPEISRHLIRPVFFRAAGAFSRLKALLGGYSDPRLRAALDAIYARVGPEVFAERVRATFTVDAREALAQCPVPLLVLAAGSDWVVPARNARELVRGAGQAQLRVLAGSHLALATHPEEHARAIESFCDSACSPG